MGGREMGYMGPGLPGQRSVASDDDREFVENLWGIPRGTLRTEVGSGTIDLFSRMADGQIKACWIVCTNPVASVANRKTVLAGLERAGQPALDRNCTRSARANSRCGEHGERDQ